VEAKAEAKAAAEAAAEARAEARPAPSAREALAKAEAGAEALYGAGYGAGHISRAEISGAEPRARVTAAMVWPSSSGRDPFEDEDDEGGGDTYSGDIGTYGADYTPRRRPSPSPSPWC
jgi:hypothetical protein